jgi:ketosteroid isomerase-like protein
MSREDVEVVRRVWEAWERRDEPSMRALMDPDTVVVQLPDQPDVGPYHGPDGVLRAMAEWIDAWDNYAIERRDMREIGDSVLVSAHQRGRGQASGVQMEADVFFVFRVQRRKIVRWRMFSSEREALEAIGLRG